MKRSMSGAALAALFVAASAHAAPVLTGKYIVTVQTFCQTNSVFDFGSSNTLGDDYMRGLGVTGGGKTGMVLLEATFNSTKGTVQVNGFDAEGELEIFHLTGSKSGQFGSPITESPDSGKQTYSTSDTSFTIGSLTLHAFYGQEKKGVSGLVVFQGAYTQDDGTHCMEQGRGQKE